MKDILKFYKHSITYFGFDDVTECLQYIARVSDDFDCD